MIHWAKANVYKTVTVIQRSSDGSEFSITNYANTLPVSYVFPAFDSSSGEEVVESYSLQPESLEFQ
jgi:hypothetical protein